MLKLKRIKFNFLYLLITVILFSVLGWFVNSYIPENLTLIGLFLFLILAIIFFLVLFFTNNVRQGGLGAFGAVMYLILRLIKLDQAIYILTLILILLIINYLFNQK